MTNLTKRSTIPKNVRALIATGLLLAGFTYSASAIVLPPLEDGGTSSSAVAGNTAGKATSLPVSATHTALVRFGAGNRGILPANVRQARLTIYVTSVIKKGTNTSNMLQVKLVTSDWHEISNTVPVNPTIGSLLADLGEPTVATAKHFLVCDVTDAVKGWLADPSSDFGFAITASGAASVLLGSKEGSSTGYPASLEIDTGELGAAVTIANNGNVGIGTQNPAAPLEVNGAVQINGAARVSGLLRTGSETGTSEAPNRSGIVIRRINSTSAAVGQIVARSVGTAMTLERDGTPGGLIIKVVGSAGEPVIAGVGIDCHGNSTNVYKVLYNGGVGTNQIFTTSQSIGFVHLTFGDAGNAGDMTEVVMSRVSDCAGNDLPNWVGTVTSTVNQ